jgi:carbohydrate-selective porin OprB
MTENELMGSNAATGYRVQNSAPLLSRLLMQGRDAVSWAEERGVTFGASYIFDYSVNGAGGIRRRDTARSLFDLSATWNLKPVLDIDDGTAFLNFQNLVGRDASRDTGDLQKFSNIDGNSRMQLAEFWYEQWLFSKRCRFKIGRMQSDSDFAFVENGGEFIHGSQGHSPTIFVMPVYPDPASGLALFLYPTETMYLSFGMYDGVLGQGVHTGIHGPHTLDLSHLFFIGEIGKKWTLAQHRLSGRLSLGGWGHNGTFTQFSESVQHGTAGLYLVLEQMLWRKNPELEEDAQGIATFLQYGYADKTVSEIAHHLGAGLTWTGFFSGRDNDVIGIGTNWAWLSDDAGFRHGYELAFEWFYKFAFSQQMVLKLDLHTSLILLAGMLPLMHWSVLSGSSGVFENVLQVMSILVVRNAHHNSESQRLSRHIENDWNGIRCPSET